MAESEQAVPISAPPTAGQLVEHDGKRYTTIREGQAHILIPPNTRTTVDPKKSKAGNGDGPGEVDQNVFYNPIQQFNRDLSVLAIKAFGEDLCARRRAERKTREGKKKAQRERKKSRQEQGKKEEEGGAIGNGDGGKEEVGVAVEGNEKKRKRDAAETEVAGEGSPAKIQRTAEESAAHDDLAKDIAAQPVAEKNGGGSGAHSSQEWKPKFRVLDALSATGLRALRYASEIPFATSVTANDLLPTAAAAIRTNVEHNALRSKIEVNTGNAIGHMYHVAFPPEHTHGPMHESKKYDVIDLDPYGTAAPFIDSALQALNDGGMLCVTCTDSGVWASCGYSEKTFSLYGGMPIKGAHSHEGGLRLIIQSVAATAAKYGMAIEPLLSLSIDFYVRIFIRVIKSPADVKFLSGKTMLTYGCDAGCGAYTTQFLGRNARQTGKAPAKDGNDKNPTYWFKHTIAQAPSVDRLCEHCGSKMHVAGPMWGGPLHNASFVEKLMADVEECDAETYGTKKRVEGMLDTALSELLVVPEAERIWSSTSTIPTEGEFIIKTPPETIDQHPFFFIPSAIAKVIHSISPPEAPIKGALRGLGYKATRSHCKPGSIKTDAPWSVIWEIMREWTRQKHPIKEGSLREGQPGWRIMAKTRSGAADDETNGGAQQDEMVESGDIGEKGNELDVSKLKVRFDEVLGKDKQTKRLVRYQTNPRENWGPMTRAKGSG
ncbi:N2,N2-dimethylguanosine tRNA methyltransferase [Teratosphaeria nubilosa]|uniref:tRNA (guanine(26)-N(2))-dimethyltransferase n=1 Tax=Teratosphaeria nubilosa TaxID=161662 RepID=A0A6G1L4W7_9PEZI|nr:N2,N2-dimethylguanosine tRNA methyltransferase [Teratosphaeria nubilosa]